MAGGHPRLNQPELAHRRWLPGPATLGRGSSRPTPSPRVPPSGGRIRLLTEDRCARPGVVPALRHRRDHVDSSHRSHSDPYSHEACEDGRTVSDLTASLGVQTFVRRWSRGKPGFGANRSRARSSCVKRPPGSDRDDPAAGARRRPGSRRPHRRCASVPERRLWALLRLQVSVSLQRRARGVGKGDRPLRLASLGGQDVPLAAEVLEVTADEHLLVPEVDVLPTLGGSPFRG
jgi:hypothetical protein